MASVPPGQPGQGLPIGDRQSPPLPARSGTHVARPERSPRARPGLSAWELDRWGGLRAVTSRFEGP